MPHLTESEREKVLRYRFDEDRIRSVAGLCLMKAGIRMAYPDENAVIAITKLGKPYLKDISGYEFNLSHSGHLIAYASDPEQVGVDVELVKAKDWKLFHRYLTDEEMLLIESSDDPEACFFEIWTVREAFAKEEGLGLGILDKDFRMNYKNRQISYEGRTLFFKSFDHKSDERYKISVVSVHDVSEASIRFLTKKNWEEYLKAGLFSEVK